MYDLLEPNLTWKCIKCITCSTYGIRQQSCINNIINIIYFKKKFKYKHNTLHFTVMK